MLAVDVLPVLEGVVVLRLGNSEIAISRDESQVGLCHQELEVEGLEGDLGFRFQHRGQAPPPPGVSGGERIFAPELEETVFADGGDMWVCERVGEFDLEIVST